MSAPVITTSDPLNGAVNVYLNSSLKVTFQDYLDSLTVNTNNVVLTDVASSRAVLGSVSYVSGSKQIIFSPENYLSSDTQYRLGLVGSDIALGTGISTTGSGGSRTLATSQYIVFNTGRDIYRPNAEVTTLNETLAGDLDLPSNIAVIYGSFSTSGFSPEPNSHGYDIDNTSFYIDFSQDLSGFTQSMISVEVEPLFDEDYIARDINGTVTFKIDAADDQLSSFADPIFSGSVSGNRLTISITAGSFSYNQLISLTIAKELTSSLGERISNSDINIQFGTEIWPNILTLSALKRQFPSALNVTDAYTDLYLSAKLHQHTILGWEMSGRRHSLVTPPKALRDYAMYSTLIDILDDVDLSRYLQAGLTRQLGDFLVKVDSNIIGKSSVLLARLRKSQAEAIATLRKTPALLVTWISSMLTEFVPNRLWHGVNENLIDYRFKYWQPNLPGSQFSIQRHAEVPPIV